MNMLNVKPPLSNIQVLLLKLFSRNIPDGDLVAIKKIIAGYLLERAWDRADKIWDERGYTDEKLQQLLEKK